MIEWFALTDLLASVNPSPKPCAAARTEPAVLLDDDGVAPRASEAGDFQPPFLAAEPVPSTGASAPTAECRADRDPPTDHESQHDERGGHGVHGVLRLE